MERQKVNQIERQKVNQIGRQKEIKTDRLFKIDRQNKNVKIDNRLRKIYYQHPDKNGRQDPGKIWSIQT